MTYENRVKPAASSTEREARLAKQRIEAEQAIKERRQADAAFRANYERLKAERRARESQDLEVQDLEVQNLAQSKT